MRGAACRPLTGSGGYAAGPPAASLPAVVEYNNQMHVCYIDGKGLIQDVWNDGSTCNVPWYRDQALQITGHYAGETGPLNFSFDNPFGDPFTNVVNEIDGGRPISIRIAWFGGGAHNVVITGYDIDLTAIDVEDPIYGYFPFLDFNTFPTTYRGGATWPTTYLTQ